MTPAQRVRIIQRIAKSMVQNRDVPEIAFVLRQFGAAVYDPEADREWDGDVLSWVRYTLGDVDAAILQELDEFELSGGSPSSITEASQAQWEPGLFRLFVSHTHAHAELAGDIRKQFKMWRIDAFVAHDAIGPTREWERAIEASLRTCDAMAALITDDFQRSEWCDQEVGFCLARSIPIVPAKLRGKDPQGFIRKFQAAAPRTQSSGPGLQIPSSEHSRGTQQSPER
jgi:hypothetical protein